MALTLTDEELALFAKLPRAVLTDLVKVVARMPHEYWGDLATDLETAEKRVVAGCIKQDLHHDARGVVRNIKSVAERFRQAMRRKSA